MSRRNPNMKAKETDPQWAKDRHLSREDLWQRRSEDQLIRAREAEDKVAELQEEVRRIKHDRVRSVGTNVLDCLQNLAADSEWGKVDPDSITPNDGSDDDPFDRGG